MGEGREIVVVVGVFNKACSIGEGERGNGTHAGTEICRYAKFLTICLAHLFCEAVESAKPTANTVGCQHKSTFGRDYRGTANTTVTGIPCQRWSDTQPHEHPFTHVGDHNYCRNPVGTTGSKVWCYTTDPKHRAQYCSVPFCPPLKVLDFSLDND